MSFPRYSEYKNSGIKYLDTIPRHWTCLRARAAGNFSGSGIDKKLDSEETPVKMFNYLDVYNSKDKVLRYNENLMVTTTTEEKIIEHSLRNGDLLFTPSSETADDIGHAALVKVTTETVVYSYHLIRFRPINIFYSEFLKYYFNSIATRSYFESVCTGTTRMVLAREDFKNTWLTCPSIEEQKIISNFLDHEIGKIDALILEQEKLIELLKEQRKAVITHTVTKGLDQRVKMKDSGIEWLGEVPEHWKVLPLKRFFQLVVDIAPKENDCELLSLYTDIGVRPRKDLEARGNRSTTTDGYFKVSKGDIVVNKLLAWMGAIGVSEYDGVTSPAYDILRAKQPLSPHYYDYLFRCGILFTEFKRYSRGIMDMRLRLYFEEFGQFLIPFPSYEEQLKIVDVLNEKLSKFDLLREQATKAINLLEERRSALISAAVTGQIDVRNYQPKDVA